MQKGIKLKGRRIDISEEEKEDIESLRNEVLKLHNQLKNKDEEVKQNEKYADLLSDLFQKGIIDADVNSIQNINDF